MRNLIWEFYKTEKYTGVKATAYDIVINGSSRSFIFCNDPSHQRLCHCQRCGVKIPREVPRIKLDASYFYGAGYYCMKCGIEKLREKEEAFKEVRNTMDSEIIKLKNLEKLAKEVMEDEFYPKKMALAKMLQVMEENQHKRKR